MLELLELCWKMHCSCVYFIGIGPKMQKCSALLLSDLIGDPIGLLLGEQSVTFWVIKAC